MSSVFKFSPLLLATVGVNAFAQTPAADSDAGFLIGAGAFAASVSDCSYNCDYSGKYAEIGYDFNEIVGLEAKLAQGDGDEDNDVDVAYAGLNIGHDFNTGWFRLYGKIGYAQVDEFYPEKDLGCDYYYCYTQRAEEFQSSGVTLGIGTRFTLSGEAQGVYLKAESMAVSLRDDSVSAAFLVGIGYRF